MGPQWKTVGTVDAVVPFKFTFPPITGDFDISLTPVARYSHPAIFNKAVNGSFTIDFALEDLVDMLVPESAAAESTGGPNTVLVRTVLFACIRVCVPEIIAHELDFPTWREN